MPKTTSLKQWEIRSIGIVVCHCSRIIPFVADRKKFNVVTKRCVRRHFWILLPFVISEIRTSLHASNFANSHSQ